MGSPSTVLDWTPVEETLAAFRTEYAGLDGLVEELFGEVEKLREKLSNKAAEVERHRQEAEERRLALRREHEDHVRLAQQFEQQERQLSAALTLLEEVKLGLEETPAAFENVDLGKLETETQVLREERETFRAERDALRGERDALQSERDVLRGERDAIIGEREALRGERDALRNERDTLREERDALRRELETLRTEAPQWSKLLAEMERLETNLQERLQQPESPTSSRDETEKVSRLEQERAALVAELEQVRSRAAELHDNLHQQQRTHAEQNSRLLDEIQQLRRVVERQATTPEPLAHDLAPGAANVTLPTASKGEAAPAAADPVVSSVMAQFAQLQKDVSQRRKRK